MEKQTNYEIPRIVTLFPKNDEHDSAESPLRRLEARFENGASMVTLPTIEHLNSEQAEALSDQIRSVSTIQDLHTVLSRRSTNHPHKFGLVAQQLPKGHVGPNAVSVSEAAGGRQGHFFWGRNAFISPELDLELLPAELHGEGYGWFAPDADPTVFGTLYMVPTGLLEESYRTRGQVTEFGWALAQVGIEDYLERAPWDDTTTIERLANRALSDDVETVTTMRALSDSASVAEGLKRHQYRQALRDARVAFENLTLRPRLVPQVVEDTLRAHSLTTSTYGYYNRPDGENYGLVTLDDYSVFGWQNQPKPMAAAYVVALENKPKKSDFIAFATALQEKLAARKLGTVAVLPGQLQRLWVVRDLALLSRFGNVFAATQDAPFVAFSDWMEAGAPVRA